MVITQPNAVTVDSQPSDSSIASGDVTPFSVTAINADTYLWQISTDGVGSWANVVDDGSNPSYSGANTATLNMTGVLADSNGNLYRVLVSNDVCTAVVSNAATLTVNNVIEENDDDFSATVIYDDAGGNADNVPHH